MDSITQMQRVSSLAERDREAYWEAVDLLHVLTAEEFEKWLDSLGPIASPMDDEEEM